VVLNVLNSKLWGYHFERDLKIIAIGDYWNRGISGNMGLPRDRFGLKLTKTEIFTNFEANELKL
jgi:hypothetical protein